MDLFKIALISILFGAANTMAWIYLGLEPGTAGGAGGAAAAVLFFGLHRRSKKQ